MRKNKVVIGFLGSQLDAGWGAGRWEKWRPTVSLVQHDDLVIDRLELLPAAEAERADQAAALADDRVERRRQRGEGKGQRQQGIGAQHDGRGGCLGQQPGIAHEKEGAQRQDGQRQRGESLG